MAVSGSADNRHDRVMRGVSANSPLPPSVETAYYRKCIELKRRINDIEESNDALRLKKLRMERAILKQRMERAILLDQIAQKMRSNPDDSDESDSPPPTPQDRPLRSKRAHRKVTPPPTGEADVPESSPPDGPPQQGSPETSPQADFRHYVPQSTEDSRPATQTPSQNGHVQLPPLATALGAAAAVTSGRSSGFSAINAPAAQNGIED